MAVVQTRGDGAGRFLRALVYRLAAWDFRVFRAASVRADYEDDRERLRVEVIGIGGLLAVDGVLHVRLTAEGRALAVVLFESGRGRVAGRWTLPLVTGGMSPRGYERLRTGLARAVARLPLAERGAARRRSTHRSWPGEGIAGPPVAGRRRPGQRALPAPVRRSGASGPERRRSVRERAAVVAARSGAEVPEDAEAGGAGADPGSHGMARGPGRAGRTGGGQGPPTGVQAPARTGKRTWFAVAAGVVVMRRLMSYVAPAAQQLTEASPVLAGARITAAIERLPAPGEGGAGVGAFALFERAASLGDAPVRAEHSHVSIGGRLHRQFAIPDEPLATGPAIALGVSYNRRTFARRGVGEAPASTGSAYLEAGLSLLAPLGRRLRFLGSAHGTVPIRAWHGDTRRSERSGFAVRTGIGARLGRSVGVQLTGEYVTFGIAASGTGAGPGLERYLGTAVLLSLWY